MALLKIGTYMTNYDLSERGSFTSINIARDLHCWQMSFTDSMDL